MKTAFALTMTVLGAAAVAAVPAACNTHTAIGEVRDAAVASGGMGGRGGVGPGSGGAGPGSGGSGGSGGVLPPSASGGTPGSGGQMSSAAGAPGLGGAPASSHLALGPSVTYPVPGAFAVALADMNGDRASDVVALGGPVATGGANGNGAASGGAQGGQYDGTIVYVLGNDGKGAFGPADNVGMGYLSAIAVGDVDGDGKPDLAATNPNNGSISLFINDGSGRLSAPTSYSVGKNPVGVIIGDLDRDGRLDIGTANHGDPSHNGSGIGVLLNDGHAAFLASTYAAGPSPNFLLLADLDGDGRGSLVVGDDAGGVRVMTNDGMGQFGGATGVKTYAAGSSPRVLASGDLNGDGKTDIVVAGGGDGGGGVGILLNVGNGGLGAAIIYSGDRYPTSVAVGDLNGDGYPDLIASFINSGTIGVYLNNGTGAFRDPVGFETDGWVSSLAVGDVNGDGKLDVVAANANGVAVLLNAR
jgi:hypothetical protein